MAPRSTAASPDEILTEREGEHYRAAALARGRLVDVMTVPLRTEGTVGSVYLGKVVRIMSGLGAAFVDIGLDRPAFLNLAKSTPPEGKPVAVQLTAEARGDKAASVSTRIALPGRYLVLLPREKGIAASRRLDAEMRNTLIERVRPLAETHGVLIRAAALAAKQAALVSELAALRKIWAQIEVGLGATPPVCLHQEHGLRRILCEFGGVSAVRFVFADAATASLARALARSVGADLDQRIEAEQGSGSLFDRHDIGTAIASAAAPEVSLPSGGRIRVETAAALTAIDVDSGAGSAARDAAIATNLEAAQEIARQLRLRQLGGMVLIDFIRMQRRGERERVLRTLTDAVETDRATVQVLGWTRGGLVELIRTRGEGA